jgi:streptomycin 6-kinase
MLENYQELINAVTRHGYTWGEPLDGDSREVGRVFKKGRSWVAKRIIWEEDERSLSFCEECAKLHLAPTHFALEKNVLIMEDLGDVIAAAEVERDSAQAKAVGAFLSSLHQLKTNLPLVALSKLLIRQQESWIDNSPHVPSELKIKSRKILGELVSLPQEVVLHGDAHAWNLICKDQQVFLIDPVGAWGSPSFEVAYFAASLANPLDALAATRAGYASTLPNLSQWLWWCLIYRYAIQKTRGSVFRPETRGSAFHKLLKQAEEIRD